MDIDPLIATRTTCQINPELHYSYDCHRFLDAVTSTDQSSRTKNLEQAIQLYSGSFLEGFTLRNLPSWEEWLFHRREELRHHFLDAAVELGQLYLQSGEASKSLEPFMRVLITAPDLEPAHEGIIRAYADQGKDSEALRQYATYVDVMHRNYNAPPRAELVELIEKLRHGDYQKTDIKNQTFEQTSIQIQSSVSEPKFVEVIPTLEGSGNINHTPTLKENVTFIGREQELATFDRIISDVKAGNGQALIISGEMGIGKTRLFQQFREQLPPEFLIGMGESQEMDSAQPIAELIHAVEMIGSDPRLSPEMKRELDILLTKQEQIVYDYDDSSETNFLEQLHRWIIKLLNHAPVTLVIDDLHWASEAVLNFFARLATDVKRLPLLLVGIFRTFEQQSEDTIAASLISIARTGRLWRIGLDNLSAEETKQLIILKATRVATDLTDNDLDKLCHFSGGIPLYALELAHFLEEGRSDLLEKPILEDKPDFASSLDEMIVPPLMKQIARLRLSKLPEKYVDLLKVASLLLNDFSLDLVHHIFPMDQDQIEDMMVDLEHRNFIHHIEISSRLMFAFNHHMVKLAIRDSIPHIERRRLYKTINQSLDLLDLEVSSDTKAHYLYHGGDRDIAVPYLLASANVWFGYGDKQRSLRYSNIAFETSQELFADKPDVLGKIALTHADNLLKCGMTRSAINVYNKIINHFESDNDFKPLGMVQRRDELQEMLRSKPKFKTSKLPPLALVSTKRALANVKVIQEDFDTAQELLSQAEQALSKLSNSPNTIRETGMVLQVQAKLKLQTGLLAEATIQFENALELLKRDGIVTEIIETYRLLGHTYHQQEMIMKADSILQENQELCITTNNYVELAYCYHIRGIISFEKEDYQRHCQKFCVNRFLSFSYLWLSPLRRGEIFADIIMGSSPQNGSKTDGSRDSSRG